MNTNAFRDGEELLTGRPEFWVSFTEEVANPDRDEYHQQSGLYHWQLDVYAFIIEERVLVYTFGHPSDVQWYYTTDVDHLKMFLDLLNKVGDMVQYLHDQDPA